MLVFLQYMNSALIGYVGYCDGLHDVICQYSCIVLNLFHPSVAGCGDVSTVKHDQHSMKPTCMDLPSTAHFQRNYVILMWTQ